MLLCTCCTGHCSDWLDAVYWVPGSTSVWTVQDRAGPPSRSHLLFTQPYSLGPCPVLGCNCMFHRTWRSVLQMQWGAQCNIHSCQNMMNTNRNSLCSSRCDGVSIRGLILTFLDSLWVQFSRVTQSNGLQTYTK
jgi:hypothetical protein